MPLLQALRRLGQRPTMQDWPGLIEAYRPWLPVSASTPVITLREGATPLIPAPAISERIGRGVSVFLKYDGLNPTGSFKDRGMTMAISKAKEAGYMQGMNIVASVFVFHSKCNFEANKTFEMLMRNRNLREIYINEL